MSQTELPLPRRLPVQEQIVSLRLIDFPDLENMYVFYKPGSDENSPGYVSSFSLNIGRQEGPSLRDYFVEQGLDNDYPVDEMICFGRLDKDTSGLLLLSKKNAYPRFLDQVLLNPFFNVGVGKASKLYRADVKGIVDANVLENLKTVRIPGPGGSMVDVQVESARLVALKDTDKRCAYSIVELEINEGKYHQVKKMFYELSHPVRKGGLHRTKFAMLTLAAKPGISGVEMKAGEIRKLFASEKKQMAELYNRWLVAERKRLELSPVF